MKKLFYAFVLLAAFSVRAQDTIRLDLVKQQLRMHPQQDTVHINLLNQYAWHSDISQPLRDSLLQQSLLLSRKRNYAKGISNALAIQTLYTEMSQAINVATQAVQFARQSKDPETLFWAKRALGQAMLNTSGGVQALDIFKEGLTLATQIGNPLLIMQAQLNFVDYYKTVQANYPLALQWNLQALRTAEGSASPYQLSFAYRNLGGVYLLIGNQEKALENLQKALTASRQGHNAMIERNTLNDIGERYRLMNKYPEALQAYNEAAKLIKDSFNIELNQSNIADVYQRMGNDSLAFQYGFLSLQGARNLKDTIGISWIYSTLSRAYLHTGRADSAIWYAQRGYDYAVQTNVLEYIRDNSEVLANAFSQKKAFEKAFAYYKIFVASRDSIINNEVTNKSNLAQYEYDLSKKQAEIAVLNKSKQLQQEKAKRQQLMLVAAVVALVFISVILILLYRNIRQRNKAYIQLNNQKQQLQIQRDEKEKALEDLKAAQSKLIQSEKMASLGELTAGIAHEIQNPLNFVNNFSEVSKELLEELQEEINKGDMQEVSAIADDLKTNLEKIVHHGKRADNIVKGMLQHSRASTGTKEPTNINALADEYLRLSYHGLRAKDKTFNADFTTHFDESIGKIAIVPQDIGRVLLNLYNNAFYAVAKKKKQAAEAYHPVVSVSTRKVNEVIEIMVADNGSGIPQTVIDKVFQPFFTTKPTGEGTGLGLSIGYDIIKAHGGTMKVESKEGEGSTFIIHLPVVHA